MKPMRQPLFASKGVAQPAFSATRDQPAARPRAARASPDGATRVSLRLDGATHAGLKQLAARSGANLGDALLAALADYVSSESAAIGGCACLREPGPSLSAKTHFPSRI